MKTHRNTLKAIGPGLIWACAAIGVSHLVQSTRAGAAYGFLLVGVVLLANLFKYPFFEFGPRYALATGESLIDGYKRMGKWVVVMFLVLTVGTMFSIQAAVTAVTVGIITSVIPLSLSYVQWTVLLLLICGLIVSLGRYRTLDRLVKGIIVILAFATIIAFIIACFRHFPYNNYRHYPFEWSVTDVAFLVALVGWMPSAIDISVWNSLWTIAKIKDSGYRPTLKQTRLDFNIGYFGTTLLSLMFLGLGALVMYGSGISFSNNGTHFANQFFELYTTSIGRWAFPVIAIAALATMFSTTLTVLDAYPRVLTPIAVALLPKKVKPSLEKKLTYVWIVVLVTGAVLLIVKYTNQMKMLVDFATTLSFLTAPVLGYLNLRAVTMKHVPEKFRPGKFLIILSWVGLFVLTAFALFFMLKKAGIF
ncbi:MAG: Nramp family divalent metal transporter [Prolixibacteraceae bacterium]|nr:Nramp family divalent metal transporter [Prolixibacteraceae bacterium]